MTKFLWDINIENIPCGWESIYQESLIECPNGKNIELISSDYYGTNTHEVEYNPVECKAILVNRFNQLKSEAIEIYSNLHDLDFKVAINKLFKIDILLFNILSEWAFDVSDSDGSNYDPSYFLKLTTEITNQYDYFDNEESQFDKLKLINLKSSL
jgi:hypothetical protein